MRILKLAYTILIITIISSCDKLRYFEQKAAHINNYDKVAMAQSKEIRLLEAKITDLQFTIKELEAQNSFLKIKLKKLPTSIGEQLGVVGPDGGVSGESSQAQVSIIAQEIGPDKDLVKFDIFNWKPDQLFVIAENAYQAKEYEKAAQYFHTLIQEYPKNEKISDALIFQAGVSSFLSKNHNNWAKMYFSRVTQNYPAGPYYLGSKMWLGLTLHREKNYDEFYKVVEEFRLKYRNTQEWKLISGHYEELTQRYKK